MIGSIIENNGQHLVIMNITETKFDKYSPPVGTWECVISLNDGSPQMIRGAYTTGPVGMSIWPDEQQKWAVVGTISDDKIINIIKLRAEDAARNRAAMGIVACEKCGHEIQVKHVAAVAAGSVRSAAKTAANRENAKRPRPNAQGKPKPRKKPKTE